MDDNLQILLITHKIKFPCIEGSKNEQGFKTESATLFSAGCVGALIQVRWWSKSIPDSA
jgi:hypothetical protein